MGPLSFAAKWNRSVVPQGPRTVVESELKEVLGTEVLKLWSLTITPGR